MRNFSGMAILIGLSIVCSYGGDHTTKPSQQDDEMARKMTLQEYLEYLGKKNDCYFTIEGVYGNTIAAETLSCLKGDFDLKDLADDEIGPAIEKAIPDVKVIRNKTNGVVYHIVHKDCASVKDYWIERRVDVKYEGLQAGLPEAFKKALGGKTDFTSAGAMPMIMDVASRVRISVNNVVARDVLVNCLALSQKRRILWFSSTSLPKQEEVNFIFNWRMEDFPQIDPSDDSQQELRKAIDEDAYRKNPRSDEYAALAADYIGKQLTGKNPIQVRWAMLYLGKHKYVDRIDLLLKYLSYKYTDCGVVGESYPAVRALSLMGDVAADAAVKQMAGETDALRLELLCNVVSLVKKDDAAKFVEANLPADASKELKGKIDAIMRKLLAAPTCQPTSPATRPAGTTDIK